MGDGDMLPVPEFDDETVAVGELVNEVEGDGLVVPVEVIVPDGVTVAVSVVVPIDVPVTELVTIPTAPRDPSTVARAEKLPPPKALA